MISKVQKNSFGIKLNPQRLPKTAQKLEEGRILAPDLAMDVALRNFHQKSLNQDQLVKATETSKMPDYNSFQTLALQAIFGNR